MKSEIQNYISKGYLSVPPTFKDSFVNFNPKLSMKAMPIYGQPLIKDFMKNNKLPQNIKDSVTQKLCPFYVLIAHDNTDIIQGIYVIDIKDYSNLLFSGEKLSEKPIYDIKNMAYSMWIIDELDQDIKRYATESPP